jgi:hypothetical protein
LNRYNRGRHDDVHLETNQLGCEMKKSFWLHLAGWEDEEDILALHVAQLAQTLTKCLPEMNALGDGAGRKDTYPRYFSRLLRPGEMDGSEKENRE